MPKHLNDQKEGIEWTDYTWNPITGCRNSCPYCYARDMAHRFGRSFEPKFHTERLEIGKVASDFQSKNPNLPAGSAMTGIPILSFAWTTPAIEARLKTCTRRDWTDDYARRFEEGQLVAGYNRSARFGGQQIAVVRLTAAPYKEPYCQIPDTDWDAEGFAYLESIGARVSGLTPWELWKKWKDTPPDITCWVVRFEYV